MTEALLPPAIAAWPSAVLRGAGRGAVADGVVVTRMLARIRAEALFWPAPRGGARAPRVLATDPVRLAAARAAFHDADIVVTRDAARVDPARLEAVFAPALAPLSLWARLGGIEAIDRASAPMAAEGDAAAALLASARGVSPWTGEALSLEQAVDAHALLRAAAARARGGVSLGSMSRWKRRCLAPFLTGPDGPPRVAAPGGEVRAVWGAMAPAPPSALRIEDGFLRSVGLGLRHTPPISLAIHPGRPYFDATGPNSFDATVEAAEFTPALLARAARLREQVLALRLTKYTLPGAEPPPDPRGKLAVLVTGQVENDASITLGARGVRTNLALLKAARLRFPDAFLLYKPHPDVLTGLRPGAVEARAVATLADATVTRASTADCLDWADRVATITSLTGFEALLRGKAATCFGRPFYAGWGLTDDVDPPTRSRRLSLDELTAAALILHPSYIDPRSRLPAPPEVAIAALARAAALSGRPAARLERAWRDAVSWALARL